MMKRLDRCKKEELDNFEELIEPLIAYIKKRWNWKKFLPKGYKKFTENYTDYEGMSELNTDDFTGLRDTYRQGHDFPTTCALPHIAYDDLVQDRNPLKMMMGACVSYGMRVAERRIELEKAEAPHVYKSDFAQLRDLVKNGNMNIYLKDEVVKMFKAFEKGAGDGTDY